MRTNAAAAAVRMMFLCMTSACAFNLPSSNIRAATANPACNAYGRRDFCSGTFGVAAALLLPSQAAHAGDEEYKDLSTKVSSKLLTSAETAAESADAYGPLHSNAATAVSRTPRRMGRSNTCPSTRVPRLPPLEQGKHALEHARHRHQAALAHAMTMQ